jgi:hypothetical protein
MQSAIIVFPGSNRERAAAVALTTAGPPTIGPSKVCSP